MSPSPEFMATGVNRLPLLKWERLHSHNAITEPVFKVYLGESGSALSQIGESTTRELQTTAVLEPQTNYKWRVDIASADGSRVRTGDVWEITTGRFVSREVIPYPLFSAGDKWQSQSPQVGREANGVFAFKSHGHNISQALNKSDLTAGGYKLTFHANSHEQKATKPMIFSLFGKNAAGEDVTFYEGNVELNDLVKGKVDVFFKLERSLVGAQSVSCKLALPGSGGGRCPYWVFATKLSLFNNVDLDSIPNRPPRFKNKSMTLPNMPAEDNSYAFEFLGEVDDEDPASLTFRKVEGPDWVSVQPSGRVFSYHGAPMSAIGKHRLKVEVTDKDGLNDVTHAVLEVKVPGELTLPATAALLSQGNEIRFTGNLITHITRDDATATWTFKPAKTAEYDVVLYAGSPDDNVAKMTINGTVTQFPIKKTGNYRNMQPQKVGTFTLTKGRITRMVLGVVKRVDGLCDLSHVHLMPRQSGDDGS
jgi:hypothetical protein